MQTSNKQEQGHTDYPAQIPIFKMYQAKFAVDLHKHFIQAILQDLQSIILELHLELDQEKFF